MSGKVITLCLVLFVSCQKPKALVPLNIKAYEVVALPSEILGEQRSIFISDPREEWSDKLGQHRYPVIYVLDGEELFDYVASMVRFLSSVKGNTVLPKCIVVGIPNTNRNRDLTPNPIDSEPDSGGGKQFVQFLAQELLPYIDETYPTLGYRTILGHSYGGLLTAYLLYNEPTLFSNYIALDPSYQYLAARTADFTDSIYREKQLFVGVANTLIAGTEDLDPRVNWDRNHFDELMTWTTALQKVDSSELQLWSNYYEQDSHASLCVAATHDALRQLFAWYELDPSELNKLSLEGADLQGFIEAHYRRISQKYREVVPPDELLVNQAAAASMRDGHPASARALLQLNLHNYPESFNAHFLMGNFYQQQGQKDSAILYLERALAISPDERAQALLKSITEN